MHQLIHSHIYCILYIINSSVDLQIIEQHYQRVLGILKNTRAMYKEDNAIVSQCKDSDIKCKDSNIKCKDSNGQASAMRKNDNFMGLSSSIDSDHTLINETENIVLDHRNVCDLIDLGMKIKTYIETHYLAIEKFGNFMTEQIENTLTVTKQNKLIIKQCEKKYDQSIQIFQDEVLMIELQEKEIMGRIPTIEEKNNLLLSKARIRCLNYQHFKSNDDIPDSLSQLCQDAGINDALTNNVNQSQSKHNNSEVSLECRICFTHFNTKEIMILKDCYHYYCVNCLMKAIKIKIDEKTGIQTIQCPFDGCSCVIDYDEIRMILTQTNKMELFVQYDSHLTEVSLQMNPNCKLSI